MQNVRTLISGAALAGLLSLSAAVQAATVFNINRTIGTGSVFGTVTTDGTIGTLGTANITGWNLTLSEGGDVVVINTGNSGRLVTGSGFSATATQLLFDFSQTGRVLFQTPAANDSGNPFWCLQGGAQPCAISPLAAGESVRASAPLSPFESTLYSRSEVIGTVPEVAQVPVPGALPLMLAGLAGLMLAWRRR